MASHAVIFTGDLRDYDDENEILEYFKRIVIGKMIRSGILEIDIESQDTIIYRFESHNLTGEWVELSRIKSE